MTCARRRGRPTVLSDARSLIELHPVRPHGPGGRACSERQPSAAVTRACIHPDVCVPGDRWGTSEGTGGAPPKALNGL